MRLRLKFLNKFHVYETAVADPTVIELLECASKIFGLRKDNVQISLNAKDFYDSSDSHPRLLSELGVVNGDIIYIRSLEKLDDIKKSLEAELADPIFRLANELITSQQYSSIYFLAIPLYVFAVDKGLNSVDSINEHYHQRSVSTIIRLVFNYPPTPNRVVFSLYQNGNLSIITGSVQSLPVRKQLILLTKDYLINQSLIDQSVASKSSLLYRRLRLLAVRIKDELIEPILLALHSEYKLPPRIHLCTLPNELFSHILSCLSLSTLGSLMLCNHDLYNRIRGCNTIWRIHLANLDAKKKPILDAALSRQQRQLRQLQEQQQQQQQQQGQPDEPDASTSAGNQDNRNELNILVNNEENVSGLSKDCLIPQYTSSSSSTLNDSDSTLPNNHVTPQYDAYERFLARHKSLSIQRRSCGISPSIT
ncbi:unnamed protein product [Trichobilharzia szidati]|nr:unnamed protein product [Trichobilharzia szidati]